MRILILNGPNLNWIGKREISIYGTLSFDELLKSLQKRFSEHQIVSFQSNCEGMLIDRLQQADSEEDAVIFNPGAYAHTSIALADAVRSLSIPTVEVHISDIYKREPFRHHSFTAEACIKNFVGFGMEGYAMAIDFLVKKNQSDLNL
ncbi:MAG: 3-dehydroquinate dehydratase [Lentimicrobiaceae bacterium]|jgi:3-dehydroquinate dehydratase-2|nr:3-dehydroquinate dehydratase [Lentimicrobiaceae bacterium]